MDCLQNTRADCKIESIQTTGKQHKTHIFSVDGFCGNCSTVFEAIGCFHHSCDCQLVKEEANAYIVKRWHKRRRIDAERKNLKIGKRYEREVWECLW